MYIYIYVRILCYYTIDAYVCIRICIHIYIYVYTHTHTHTHTYIHISGDALRAAAGPGLRGGAVDTSTCIHVIVHISGWISCRIDLRWKLGL